MNTRDRDWLLGRRFTTDFTVVAIGAGTEPEAVLLLNGERYAIGLDELQTIIERGFVVEHPGGRRLR
jgi:hypothetical protein